MFDSLAEQKPAACSRREKLLRIAARLDELGFRPPSLVGNAGSMVSGMSLRLPVADIVLETPLAERFHSDLASRILKGIPVCLVATDFPRAVPAIRAWHQCCEHLGNELARRRLPSGGIAIGMHAHRMPLEAYWLIANAVLGRGTRYVFLDSLQMNQRDNPAISRHATRSWRFLWRQRSTSQPLLPVYGGLARSACSLLAHEVAAAVLPHTSLLVPRGSAWVALELSLPAFLNDDANINWPLLSRSITSMMPLADALHDVAQWASAAQQHDAIQNRRLAVELTGLGDIIHSSGRSPRAAGDIRWLLGVVKKVRDLLRRASASLAQKAPLLPALQEGNPVGAWSPSDHKERWQSEWQAALGRAALGHRSLMCLAPTSFIPAHTGATAEYAELLPALALADTWSFRARAAMDGWNLHQFTDFHRRARAVIQAAERASFVADRV